MKTFLKTTVTVAVILAGYSTAMAARDFTGMTNDELAASRKTLQNESRETREAFRVEWQKRIATMPPEERAQFEKTAGIDRMPRSEEDENAGCN